MRALALRINAAAALHRTRTVSLPGWHTELQDAEEAAGELQAGTVPVADNVRSLLPWPLSISEVHWKLCRCVRASLPQASSFTACWSTGTSRLQITLGGARICCAVRL